MAKKRTVKASATVSNSAEKLEEPNGEKIPPHYAFRELARMLANLLDWAVDPWPNPHDEEWLAGQKRAIAQAMRSARNATADKLIANKVFDANGKARAFACLLQSHPSISTVQVEHWTVPAYQRDFNDLSLLQREFKQIADELEAHTVAETLAPGEPTQRQITRVRAAIKTTGKSASPKRVLTALKADNAKGEGMKEQTFRKCLQKLTERGEFNGNERTRTAKK